MALKVFVDFDGTISRSDVGSAFFRSFSGPSCTALIDEYKEGRISAVECFQQEADSVGAVNKSDADLFFRAQQIDESFRDFVAYCEQHEVDLLVVSDGLDYYIHEILEANGIRGVQVLANHAQFVPLDGDSLYGLKVQFPFTDVECTRCACCKRNAIVTRSADKDIIIYVGDGYSDTCPVQYADIVFAKAQLQTFCRDANVSYFPYKSFQDVIVRLEMLERGGRQPRHNRRAELMRRDLFLQE